MKALGLNPIGEAAARAARHRKFSWCRRHNGFSDLPLWRVVAAKLEVPLSQVQAFVNRLEEYANAADPRGYVGDFSAAEFGAALGISTAEAERIFGALEDREIGWIDQDHVATFWPRNPDKEDDTVNERKRRQRARDKGMKELARRARRGEITEAQRQVLERELLLDARLSTGHGGHIVTHRDIVTVTPRAEHRIQEEAGDNSGDATRGEDQGLPKEGGRGESDDPQAEAAVWLMSTGKLLLIERLQIPAPLAETYIERWHRDLQDAAALREIIEAAEQAGYIGPRFHTLVTDQLKRRVFAKQHGPQLPLPPSGVVKKAG